jgi:hypothetical protein
MHDDVDNPYAPPKSESLNRDRHLDYPDPAWCDGNTLVARKGAELPDRCIKCNAPAGGFRFKRNLSWHSPGWYIFLISPLIYIIVYLLVRRGAKITVGLCPSHRKKRAWAIALSWLSGLAGIGMYITVIIVSENHTATPSPLVPIGLIGGFVLLFAGLLGGMFGSQALVPTRIDKHFVWLRRVSTDYLAELPDWNA